MKLHEHTHVDIDLCVDVYVEYILSVYPVCKLWHGRSPSSLALAKADHPWTKGSVFSAV